MSRFPPHCAAMVSGALLALVVLAPTAGAQERVRLEGAGSCAGVTGRYLAAVVGGSSTVVSGAEFPGGTLAGSGLEHVTSSTRSLWQMSVGLLPAETSGCVAFDKDRFTWPGDVATYVQYLVRELLASAQRLDPTLRTLAIGERSVRLRVSRPGVDTAVLSGPEGAMLGYGRRSEPERYFFLPVLVGAGDRLMVRIFSNRGEPFGERSTGLIGAMFVPASASARSETAPVFEVRWIDPP